MDASLPEAEGGGSLADVVMGACRGLNSSQGLRLAWAPGKASVISLTSEAGSVGSNPTPRNSRGERPEPFEDGEVLGSGRCLETRAYG